MSADTQLESLITRHLDGSAKDADSHQLAELITGDSAHAARFVAACRTDHALASHFESEAAAVVTRRELADTIARSEERENTAAKVTARRERGEAAVLRIRNATKPVLRAAAALALLAVAAYALWPEAPSPSVARENVSGDPPVPEKRKIIPDGQPLRSTGTVAQQSSVKSKLTAFHLPATDIEGESIDSALEDLLGQYQTVASSHGEEAIPATSIRIAEAVDRSSPVRLNLNSSIPVSTALTSIALQSGARVRYTGDGAVIEPYSVEKPDEMVTRAFHLSESAFRWMSAGASTEWGAPEEGVSWDASNILRTHGIPLDREDERTLYAATEQKLHVTATRDHAARIDALRSAASSAGRSQIFVTSKIVTLPLGSSITSNSLNSESVDLEARLPAIVESDRLISDVEYQVLIRSASQMKGADITTMPSVMSLPGQEAGVSIAPEVVEFEGFSFNMGMGGFDVEDHPGIATYSYLPDKMTSTGDQIHVATTFVPTESLKTAETVERLGREVGQLETELETIQIEFLDTAERLRDLDIMRTYTYPAEAAGDESNNGASTAKSAPVIDKNGNFSTYDAATGETVYEAMAAEWDENELGFSWLLAQRTHWEEAELQLKVMESEEAQLKSTMGDSHPQVIALKRKNEIAWNELMKEAHGSFDHAAAAVRSQGCASCHTSSEPLASMSPFMRDQYALQLEPQSKAPSLNFTANLEGRRIRIAGEFLPASNSEVPVLGDLPVLGRLFHPATANNDGVEFDAVLAEGEHLMLEAARTDSTRTLIFLQAKRVKS